MDISLDSSGF